MNKLLLLLVLFSNLVFSQNKDLDVALQKIVSEKNVDTRIDKLYKFTMLTKETDPLITSKIVEKLLILEKEHNDKITETFAISLLSYQCLITGNKTKSLQYALKSLEMAEKIGNNNLLAIVKTRVAHNLTDYSNKKEKYKEALKNAFISENLNLQRDLCNSIGQTYTKLNILDSALYYFQKSEQLIVKTNNNTLEGAVYKGFGDLYVKMKKPDLAKMYFNLALKKSKQLNQTRLTNYVYYSLAEFYYKENQIDSSIIYAKKTIETSEKTPFSNDVMLPAKLLKDIYRNKNNDLAMQYADMYQIANDSVNSLQGLQRNQLLMFDENLRQQEIKEQQNQNLQYIFIAIGILSLIILFLFLSRSFITNTKLIQFFGVVGLLIVFEFLNLLLHPFLEKITHHSPILMLLALVAIAALLVPLHHKVEHWTTAKLVEKNKQIRLANAKKTLEELDIKTENN